MSFYQVRWLKSKDIVTPGTISFSDIIGGVHILRLPAVDSTNTYAKSYLEALEHRTVVVADIQTAGRGRQSHLWRSDIPGNIYASLILKLNHSAPDDLPVLTQVLAKAIINVLSDFGVDATMKWPNDVMVDGKKIAGILAEAITQGLQVKGVVLGFGINLAMSQEILDRIDQPATSLNLLIDRLVDRDEFLEKVVAQFFRLSNS